jgi:hypothetical protein
VCIVVFQLVHCCVSACTLLCFNLCIVVFQLVYCCVHCCVSTCVLLCALLYFSFVETFQDEGQTDMHAALLAWKDVRTKASGESARKLRKSKMVMTIITIMVLFALGWVQWNHSPRSWYAIKVRLFNERNLVN